MDMGIKGKRAIVTGGGSGIGFETARQFLEEGVRVLIAGRTLDKINKALVKIDDGTFGVCEECGEEISVKRLEARPETTLCIKCKEDQEREERTMG